MTFTPRIADDPGAMVRRSRPLADVAAMLGCDPSHIRKLIDRGELEAFRYGRRGIAIFLDSVNDFQDRNRIEPRATGRTAPRKESPRPASTAAHRAAMVGLEAKGLLRPPHDRLPR